MQTPAEIDYARASSVDEAIALLEEHGEDARIIAGGHSLLPMMKLRLARPEWIIDINDLHELRAIRVEGGELVLGALTRHADVLESAVVAEHYPILVEAERVIADPIVRNRGTVGGSFCQADPAEDLAAVGSALRATVVIRSSGGTRTVPAREFHTGPYETEVGPAELLVEVRIPIRPSAGSAYEKVERRAGDWAIAAAGAFVELSGGVVSDVGIGLSAVGARHYCAAEAEEFLRGRPPTPDNLAEAGRIAAQNSAPTSDQRGPADYKRHLVGELTRRALSRSVQRAGGGA